MEHYTKLELSVGAFVLLGGAALAYLGLTLGEMSLDGGSRYAVTARFASVGDLKVGDPVKMAGVGVGEVTRLALADFVAEVELSVERTVVIPSDTIASIQSAGLLGDAYVSLSPGAALEDLSDGERITRTEPALSITELISKYAFGSPLDDEGGDGNGDPQPGGPPARGDAPDAPAASPFEDPLQ